MWTAGPHLSISGLNSANASVSGTAPSASAGDTFVAVSYTVNGQPSSASVRFTVLSPTVLYPSNYPGGANATVPYNNGNESGYLTQLDYYSEDQISGATIQIPGMPLTEVLSTTSNPNGATFEPENGVPSTVGSNDFGLWNDNLYVVAIGGLPKSFSAVRSQSFSVNGFSSSTQQTQSYNSSYATVSTQYLHR